MRPRSVLAPCSTGFRDTRSRASLHVALREGRLPVFGEISAGPLGKSLTTSSNRAKSLGCNVQPPSTVLAASKTSALGIRDKIKNLEALVVSSPLVIRVILVLNV